ncbi:hypothetical protein K456DRAFT_27845 [Colletotrichum gloeosporioides 23]|nr:hypothetical protein K456DRAFT_27845 [Colletotrichum gloeosporioides 23]
MEFMLAFGSVGDFIAVAKLIKDIIAALDDCRGSAKNYRDVVRELEILHRTVQQVERIYDDNTLEVHLDDLKALATSNLAQINGSLHDFRDRTQKFSPSLSEDGTKNRARDAIWKIQWKFKEHEVIKFNDEIRGHTASLSMLLGITNIRLTQRSHQDYIEQALNDENHTLDAIKRSGQSMKRYVGAIGKQLFSKLSSMAEIGIQIQRSTSNIMTMMVALSGELNGIKSILMRLHVDRPLSDEYFTLEDSTGRVFPIHLRTITSWDAFEYVLMDRFKGKKGAHRVKKKRYTLKERANNREVNRSLEWESAFLPHQMMDMSLMCRETASNAQKRHPASCPWCHEMSPGKAGAQAQCKKCNMFFTRVVELDDAEILPKSASKGTEARRRAIRFGEPAFPRSNNEIGDEQAVSGTPMVPNDKPKSCGPQCERLNRKRPNTAHDSDSDDEDFQGHTRITFVSKGKRPGPFFAEQQETFATAARRLFENATGSFMKETHTDAARPTQFLPKSSKQNVHHFKFGSHARDKSFSQSIPFAQGFEDIRKTATGDLDEDSDEESLLGSEQTRSKPEEVPDMPEQIPYAPEQPNYRRRKDLQVQLNTESEDNENILLPYEPEMMAWMRATIYLGKYLKKPQPGEGPFCGHEHQTRNIHSHGNGCACRKITYTLGNIESVWLKNGGLAIHQAMRYLIGLRPRRIGQLYFKMEHSTTSPLENGSTIASKATAVRGAQLAYRPTTCGRSYYS